jgi:hypothetical protein
MAYVNMAAKFIAETVINFSSFSTFGSLGADRAVCCRARRVAYVLSCTLSHTDSCHSSHGQLCQPDEQHQGILRRHRPGLRAWHIACAIHSPSTPLPHVTMSHTSAPRSWETNRVSSCSGVASTAVPNTTTIIPNKRSKGSPKSG